MPKKPSRGGKRASGYASESLIKKTWDVRRFIAGNALKYKNIEGNRLIEDMLEAYKPLQEGIATKDNFFYNTVAMFDPVNRRPKGKPDFVSRDRDGNVSSEYWYKDEVLIRGSSHWGNEIASTNWGLRGLRSKISHVTKTDKRYGQVKWSDIIHKSRVEVTPRGSFITTFANTTGKRFYSVGGREYVGGSIGNVMEVG